MKTVSSLLILLASVFSGCMPLAQYKLVKGSPDVNLGLNDDRRYLQLSIGSPNVPNNYKIIAEESYIQSPTRKRYGIQVEPHQYDIEQKHPYVRDDIYPIEADGSRIQMKRNGIWTVHLLVDTNGKQQAIDQQLKFSTLYYNPILHGPPN